MTATEIESDLEILNEILNQDSVPCEFEDCTEEATHALECGACGIGRELICQAHAESLATFKNPNHTIHFDKTCGHWPSIVNCTIIPI